MKALEMGRTLPGRHSVALAAPRRLPDRHGRADRRSSASPCWPAEESAFTRISGRAPASSACWPSSAARSWPALRCRDRSISASSTPGQVEKPPFEEDAYDVVSSRG